MLTFSVLQISLLVSILLIFFVKTKCVYDGDFFSSIETMEDLLHFELDLLESLDGYITEQQRILDLLTRRYAQAVKTLSNVQNKEQYVSNPINAFSLIKRLTKEWPKTLSLLHNRSVILGEDELPGDDEFKAAIKAIFRLQDVYKFSAATLASENFPGVDEHSVLTADDCLEIGYYYASIHFYELSTPWLHEALKKADEDKSFQKGFILEYLVITTCFEGDQNASLKYMETLLTAYPAYTPPPELAHDFNVAILRNCSKASAERRKKRKNSVPELYSHEIIEYNTMCRVEVNISNTLKCYYVHYNKPYLRIAPFKLEEVHLDPPIVMFHSVISDEEIAQLKNASAPYLTRAGIVMPNGSTQATDYRTSRITWIEDREDAVALRISKRVEAMTNLDIEHAEMNQISNYGVAGEYLLHSDAISTLYRETDESGNRFATFMFYLSEVLQGGNTVFPQLNVSISPKKGAGVFWFNLLPDGDVDLRMRHASCPVVLGSKWVCNKWLHEAGQELKFPCRKSKKSFKHFYL